MKEDGRCTNPEHKTPPLQAREFRTHSTPPFFSPFDLLKCTWTQRLHFHLSSQMHLRLQTNTSLLPIHSFYTWISIIPISFLSLAYNQVPTQVVSSPNRFLRNSRLPAELSISTTFSTFLTLEWKIKAGSTALLTIGYWTR